MGLRETVSGWFGQAQSSSTLRETPIPSGAYDPDSSLTASQMGSSYVKRLTTDNSRDLSAITQQRALDLSYWLYDSNPMAKRIIDSTKDSVVGQGIAVNATASEDSEREKIQRVLDDFWLDDINRMDLSCHNLCVDLALAGELLLAAYINPANGSLRLAYIDTGLIEDVIPHPLFSQKAMAVRLNAGQNRKIMLKVVALDEDPSNTTVGHLVGAKTTKVDGAAQPQKDKEGEGAAVSLYKVTEEYEFVLGRRGGRIKGVYDGSCFLFTVNGVSSSRRGRPDLLCLIDWLDAYDNMLLNEADRAVLLKTFIWDITIEGATESEIREYAKSNPPPKANSQRIHNEKVAYKSDTPDLKSADAQVLADQLLSYIATGASLPKFWLNGTMDVNRATAKEMNDPSSMHLATRRKYFKYVIERLCNYALDQAELHGRLPKRKEVEGSAGKYEPWAFEVHMPEAETREYSALASALQSVVNAVALAVERGFIDMDVAQRAIVMVMSELGIEVDLDEMRKAIEKAKAEAEEEAKKAEEEAAAGGLSPEDYDRIIKGYSEDGVPDEGVLEALR